MNATRKDKGVFHPEYYKKLYEQANERKETLQRMYDAAANREAILKEKNRQLVDALNAFAVVAEHMANHTEQYNGLWGWPYCEQRFKQLKEALQNNIS